jgi:peptidyl-prolyl cis-trans isomerase SurA
MRILIALVVPLSIASAETLDRVAAVVNDEVILQSEVDARFAATRVQALDALIDEELIVQAAVAARITVSDADVDAVIERIKTEQGLSDMDLLRALHAQGYTMAAFRTAQRRQILQLRAINQLVAPKLDHVDESRWREELDKQTARWVEQLRKQAYIDIKS